MTTVVEFTYISPDVGKVIDHDIKFCEDGDTYNVDGAVFAGELSFDEDACFLALSSGDKQTAKLYTSPSLMTIVTSNLFRASSEGLIAYSDDVRTDCAHTLAERAPGPQKKR